MAQGVYVAPEKLENVFLSSGFIAQIFVHGDPLQACVIAVIVPHKRALFEWARDNLLISSEDQLSTICQDQRVIKFFKLELYEVGKSQLRSWEIPRSILVDLEPFTPGNTF